jgi:putative transposase
MFLSTGRTPDEIKNFFGYALGRSLSLYTVDFHAGNQMGDHHHIDATDVLGNRPGFKNSFHSTLARGLNAKRGRFDSFWSGGGSCDTCQPTDEEALMDLVYTDTNPVKAGLVKWGHRWPGFTTYGWRFGETRVFKRPDWFCDPDNPDNPEEVRVTRIRPKIFMHLSDDELFDLLMQKIREHERQIQEEMRKANSRGRGTGRNVSEIAKLSAMGSCTRRTGIRGTGRNVSEIAKLSALGSCPRGTGRRCARTRAARFVQR